MDESLRTETQRLERSWMRHDASMLRDYLVAGVEDPRLNVQSILSRHFILHPLTGERFRELREQEFRFAAAMDWINRLVVPAGDAEFMGALLHALKRGADNAEGFEIPAFVGHIFAGLPARAGTLSVPNYIESALTDLAGGSPHESLSARNTFAELWREALGNEAASALSVLEPACGSANDYRVLDSCGIAPLISYTGFDLCEKNVMNARAMFSGVQFELGNVFDIHAPDRAFDLCFVHDLLEHLSIPGMERALGEICRVTRNGICLGFFQMHELPDHIVRPVDDYHWNTLSLDRMKHLFAANGFTAQALHIGSFVRERVGSPLTHNPDAYTLILSR